MGQGCKSLLALLGSEVRKNTFSLLSLYVGNRKDRMDVNKLITIKYMTTVINSPGNGDGGGSSVGLVFGLIALLVVVGLFFVYALPAIRGSGAATPSGAIDVNVKLPAGTPTPTPAAQ